MARTPVSPHILTAAYIMLRDGVEYEYRDLGDDDFDKSKATSRVELKSAG